MGFRFGSTCYEDDRVVRYVREAAISGHARMGNMHRESWGFCKGCREVITCATIARVASSALQNLNTRTLTDIIGNQPLRIPKPYLA